MRFSKVVCSVAVVAILVVAGGAAPPQDRTHPLNHLGRWLCIGWSAGYHAYSGCDCQGTPDCPHCAAAAAPGKVRPEPFANDYVDRLIRSAQQPQPKRLPPVR